MKMYDHQQKIINEDPKKCLLALGTGSGKSRTALSLARGNTLVICPKIQKEDRTWEREVEKMGLSIKMTVISKDTFRRDHKKIPKVDTLIIDEAHTVSGVTPSIRYKNKKPVPRTSQLYEATIEYIQRTNPERIYLLTATPARNPMAVYALASILGKKWDFYKFRDTFYFRLPMPGREIWQWKKDQESKKHLSNIVKSLGYVGRLDDYFDVPEQTYRYISCPLTKSQTHILKTLPTIFPDPLVLIGKMHQVEQGFLLDGDTVSEFETEKFEYLESILLEYEKVIVFVKYTHQIHMLERFLKDKIDVYTLNGETKDRDTIIQRAENSKRCVFIAQSQISTGYELTTFRCTIFMSASYSTVDNTQAQGRNLRAHALNKNLYIYLSSGEIDKAIIDCLKNHEDFSEMLYAKKRSTISNKV